MTDKNKEKPKPIDSNKAQPAKSTNPTAGAPIEIAPDSSAKDKGGEVEPDFDFGKDLEKLDDSEIKLVGSGSGSGLLNLDLPADDSTMGALLGEIYTEGAPLLRALSKKAQEARASLEAKIYAHANIMSSLGYRNIGGYYYTNGVTNIFFSKDKGGQPRAFVFYGYSLRTIVHAASTMKALQVGVNGKPAYQYLDQLATTYFKGDGVLGEGIIPSNKFSRVVFGYSVAYDPNNTDKLEPTLKAIVKAAEEKDQKMKLQIEKDLGQGTQIRRISGQAAFDLYRVGVDKYRHLKGRSVSAEAAAPEGSGQLVDLGEAIEDAQAHYGGNQAVSLSGGRGKPISVTPVAQPWYRRISALWPFGQGPKKSK